MKKIASLLSFIIIFSCSKELKNHWKEGSELYGTWVKLERDKYGYLIYDPCDGNNNFINISDDKVIYYLGRETPDTLKINSIKILNPLNEIEFFGDHEFYSIKSIMKIIDFDKKLYLLKWELTPKKNGDFIRYGKIMMTRKSFESDFRFIDNPCENERVPEKEFLPVEFY